MKKTALLILLVALFSVFCFGCADTDLDDGVQTTTTAPPQNLQEPSENFEYKTDSDTVTIKKYIGNNETVIIPDTIESKPVTVIGETAFQGNATVKTVKLPNTVRAVKWGAFSDCKNLENVILNEGLTELGHSVFAGESKIEEIVIPSTVTDIDEFTFGYCQSLKSVRFLGNAPDGYLNREIPHAPTGVDYKIHYESGASGFSSPFWNGYPTFEYGASEEIPTYEGFQYVENSNGIAIMRYVGSETEIIIPEKIKNKNVTEIGALAFSANGNIESVEIPSTVTLIGARSFYACSALSSVSLSDGVEKIDMSAFLGCSNLSDVSLPSSLTYIGDFAFSNCTALKSITVPSGVSHLGAQAFAYSGLESLTLTDGLEAIGEAAFASTEITEIILPDSIRTVGYSAFSGCRKLQSVTLSEGLVTVKNLAFGSTAIAEIIIPETAQEITELAFDHCRLLQAVKFEGNAPSDYIDESNRSHNTEYTVYYREGALGFTSPRWNGYKTQIW